jgi:uncharacterized protein (TIGR03435 family)
MRVVTMATLPLLLSGAAFRVFAQSPTPPTATGATFDVVSIRRNTTRSLPGPSIERPDGSFRMTGTPVLALLNRAYPSIINKVGLPAWAATDRYDVSTTSLLSRATADDRAAMVRAMLADRFKMAAHVERREQPVYDLVLARRDGRLGSGIQPTTTDCERILAERAAAEAGGAPRATQLPGFGDFKQPPPSCTTRIIGGLLRDQRGDRQGLLGDLLEGDVTMDLLADALRLGAGRVVINKTGLPGSYRVRMNFDMSAGRRPLDTAPPAPDAAPSVFTAVQEQLGLKLESSVATRDTLIIDHIEPPTED